MLSSFENFIAKRLTDHEAKGLKRSLKSNTQHAIDFTSNDYLGLARSPELFTNIEKKVKSIGIANGSTGSRLLSGNSAYTEAVENKLSQIFQTPATLLFNSGYTANLAVLSALPQKDDTIIYDELAHASIKDGARLSLAKRYSFKHNNVDDLEAKVRKSQGKIYVAVESYYSMDGDACPLNDLIDLAAKYDFFLIVDEAHSTGVVGENGSGFVAASGATDKVPIRIHTFGKAMGVHGACVAGSEKLREYMINFARPFVYTTALPMHSIAAIDCAFEFLRANIDFQQKLQDVITYYIEKTRTLMNRTRSHSSIQTIIIPGNEQIKNVARMLQEKKLDVRPILAPTVPKGMERLRICLHTFNTQSEIDELTHHLSKLSTI